MTTAEAIEKSLSAGSKYAEQLQRVALFIVAFGKDDPLTLAATDELDRLRNASCFWARFATLHHKTRSSMLRKGEIPQEMFGV